MLQFFRRRLLVEPVPAPPAKLELNDEIERYAVGHHLGKARCEIEFEIGVQNQAILDGAQAGLAHLNVVGACHGHREADEHRKKLRQKSDAAHRASCQACFSIRA